MSATFKVGQTVRDKFKLPKPGDGSVLGTVSAIHRDGSVTVRWDTGRVAEKTYPPGVADALIEPAAVKP